MNGVQKNWSVVRAEFKVWWWEMSDTARRFKHARVFSKGDAPDGRNANVFHLLQNFVTETYRSLPRTLGYITTFAAVVALINWMGV